MTSRLSIVRWRLVAIGACYMLALVVMTNMFFGTVVFFGGRGSTNPARTGAYGTRLPLVAPVDPHTIARSITEATGGPPTIGMPLPADQPVASTTKPRSSSSGLAISRATTPTYTAATKTAGTNNYANLLSLIPTYLTFPPKASPHRH